ncbi:MAG: type II toxin-antitoxin system prevent-host-death family antitoxin [Deltaproteobacteria bacterium]
MLDFRPCVDFGQDRALAAQQSSRIHPTLEITGKCVKLVSVTRSSTKPAGRKQAKLRAKPLKRKGYWIFQDAKARLSEVVRRARSEGPQHVTVRGYDAVVVVAEEEFRRLKGEVTGAALVAAMQAAPSSDAEMEPERARMPVRDIDLS